MTCHVKAPPHQVFKLYFSSYGELQHDTILKLRYLGVSCKNGKVSKRNATLPNLAPGVAPTTWAEVPHKTLCINYCNQAL